MAITRAISSIDRTTSTVTGSWGTALTGGTSSERSNICRCGMQTIVTRPRGKPERLQDPETFLGDRTRIDVDAPIKRRREFLQHQRYRGGDGALGVDRPDVDTGRSFRLPRDVAELGVAGIEPAVDQPARAFVRQRQYGEKAVALGGGNIEPVPFCDRPERIRVMICDGLKHVVRCQAGNILSRFIHQRGDAFRIDREDYGTSCELQRGHPVE